MSKENLERILRFKLDNISDETDVDPKHYISWAKTKADNEDIPPSYLKKVLTNHVSQDAQQTFDVLEERWQEIVDEELEVEESKETPHESTKEDDFQLSIDEDPKDIITEWDASKRERYDKASEVIAEGFQEQHHARTLFSDNDPRIYFYKDGWYQPNGESKLYEYARQCLGEAYTKRIGNRVAEKVRADTFIEEDELFDIEPSRICVKNGVLDLEEQTLYEHSPQEVHFQRLEVEYDPEASYEHLKQFLSSLFKDEEQIKVLQEIFGFCLYRKYFLKKAVIFHGDADNGKSTVIDILTRLIGQENISGIKLQRLGNRFQKSSLVHKLANIVGDLPSQELRQTGDFKALTGGDPLNYEIKGGDHYTFTNYAKLIYSANDLPRVKNPTPAFFSRWLIINFPYTFVEPSEYEEYSEDYRDRNDIKKAEPNPVEELFEEQSLRGVLNFALEGLERLLENDEFSYTRSRQENMTEWVRQSSSFQAFCMDCLEEDPDSFIVKQDLTDAYRKYCKHHNVQKNNDQVFRKDHLVDEFGVNRGRRRKQVENHESQRPSVWTGVKFKEDYEAEWKSLTDGRSCFILTDQEEPKSSQNGSNSSVGEASEESIGVSFSEGDTIYAEDYDYDFVDSKLVDEGGVMETNPGEYEVLRAELVEEVLG